MPFSLTFIKIYTHVRVIAIHKKTTEPVDRNDYTEGTSSFSNQLKKFSAFIHPESETS